MAVENWTRTQEIAINFLIQNDKLIQHWQITDLIHEFVFDLFELF